MASLQSLSIPGAMLERGFWPMFGGLKALSVSCCMSGERGTIPAHTPRHPIREWGSIWGSRKTKMLCENICRTEMLSRRVAKYLISLRIGQFFRKSR